MILVFDLFCQADVKLISYRPIPDDGFPEEVAAYNKELEQLGNPTWFQVPWLFAECYMYRYGANPISLSYSVYLMLIPFAGASTHSSP
jgi:hypothetical protein